MHEYSDKAKRFVAADMTRAMRKLSEEFGADAILLSSRRIESGVEVVGLPPGENPTITDINALHSERRQKDRRGDGRRVTDRSSSNVSLKQESMPPDRRGDDQALDATLGETSSAGRRNDEDKQFISQSSDLHRDMSASEPANTQEAASNGEAESLESRPLEALEQAVPTDLRAAASDLAKRVKALNQKTPIEESLEDVTHQLAHMKEMIQHSIAERPVPLDDFMRPDRYIVTNRLLAMGLESTVVNAIVRSAEGNTADEIWESAQDKLLNVLPISHPLLLPDSQSSHSGGVIAFVGSKGSGKTGIIVKLLAQFALEQKAEEVAVITYDTNTSSAVSRLASLSGIPLLPVSKQFTLSERIEQCVEYKLILIDTSSESASDASRDEYQRDISEFNEAKNIKEIIALPATGEARYLRQLLQEHRSDRTVGCALTFVDKSHSLGELVSLLLVERLDMTLLSTGALLPQALDLPQKSMIMKKLKQANADDSADYIDVPIVNIHIDNEPVSLSP